MKRTRPFLSGIVAALAAAFLALACRESGKTAPAASPGHEGHAPPAATPAPAKADRRILYWVDPMHPAYKSDKPGTAPDCGMDLVPVYEETGGSATARNPVAGYAAIALPPESRRTIGLRVEKVEMREVTQTIRTVGRVTFDETLLRQIHSKFEGYIEKLFVNATGQAVRKGEPLLSIYSPELLATQEEYLLAYRSRQRFASSSDPGLARGAADLYDAARRRLLLWDIRPEDLDRLEKSGLTQKALTLVSPVDGFVLTRTAVAGARVMPSDSLFEIASLERVWVLADVYESEAPFVRPGQTAHVRLSYLPGRTWDGRVTFIAPVLDAATRTLKVRIEIPNRDAVLKPEMYADVLLERPLGRVLTGPESAVLATGTRFVVFVEASEGRFEPREVEVGPKVDSSYQVLQGLGPGDAVVTQANFLIDSESRLKAAIAAMAPGERETPAPEHRH